MSLLFALRIHVTLTIVSMNITDHQIEVIIVSYYSPSLELDPCRDGVDPGIFRGGVRRLNIDSFLGVGLAAAFELPLSFKPSRG